MQEGLIDKHNAIYIARPRWTVHPRSTTQTLASGRVKRFSWESCPFVGYWRDEWECRTDQTYVRVLAVSNSRTERQDIGGRLAALDDMFTLTSTATAPWHAVPAEYKWFAPIAVAKTVVTALGKGIVVGPLPLTLQSFKQPQKS